MEATELFSLLLDSIIDMVASVIVFRGWFATILSLVTVCGVTVGYYFFHWMGKGLDGCDPLRAGCKEVSQRVPFFAAPEEVAVLEWQDRLRPALETYDASHTKALAQLARAQQVAFYSEHNMFLQSTGKKNDHNNMHSKKLFHQMISKQLERLAPLFEHNLWVMRSILLRPFVFCQAIAEPLPFIQLISESWYRGLEWDDSRTILPV
jgi:hypothetical protein